MCTFTHGSTPFYKRKRIHYTFHEITRPAARDSVFCCVISLLVKPVNTIQTNFEVKVFTVNTRTREHFLSLFIGEAPLDVFRGCCPLYTRQPITNIQLLPNRHPFFRLVGFHPIARLIHIVFFWNDIAILLAFAIVLGIVLLLIEFGVILSAFGARITSFVLFATLLASITGSTSSFEFDERLWSSSAVRALFGLFGHLYNI